MVMSKRVFSLIMVSCAILGACNNAEEDMEPDSGAIYAGYSITGEEGKDFVTAFFHFHSRSPDGPGFALKEPAKIFLDSVLLLPDSARGSGVYYELQIPLQDFAGAHTIRFIDAGNKEFREEFLFTPFVLATELPDTLKREDLILNFKGLEEKDLLRVVMMDTSFENEGINELDTVYNNRLDLRKFLPSIANGPVTLNLFKEEDRLLQKKPSGKGMISITYSLKREFELKD
jgi:hypothetical protein